MAIVKMTTREPRGLQRGNRHTTRKHPGEPGHPRKLWCHYFFAVDNMCAVCVYMPSRGASPPDAGREPGLGPERRGRVSCGRPPDFRVNN